MSSISLSDSFLWGGELRQIDPLLRGLQLEQQFEYELYYNSRSQALRIVLEIAIDEHNRATAQPGDLFWLEDGSIRSGSAEDYRAAKNA